MAKQRSRPTRRRDNKKMGSGRRKSCGFCKDKIDQVDYKDVLYFSAPIMLFLGLAMSGVTAYVTLRLYVRR